MKCDIIIRCVCTHCSFVFWTEQAHGLEFSCPRSFAKSHWTWQKRQWGCWECWSCAWRVPALSGLECSRRKSWALHLGCGRGAEFISPVLPFLQKFQQHSCKLSGAKYCNSTQHFPKLHLLNSVCYCCPWASLEKVLPTSLFVMQHHPTVTAQCCGFVKKKILFQNHHLPWAGIGFFFLLCLVYNLCFLPCLSHTRELLCENGPAWKRWALVDADSHAGTVDPFSLQSCSTIGAGDNSEKLQFCVVKRGGTTWARPHSSPWKAGQS